MEVIIRMDHNFKKTMRDTVKFKLPPKKTIRDVLILLHKRYPTLNFGDLDLDQRSFLILVNGVEISAYANLETELTPSCEIVIIPVIHGGTT